MGQRLLLDPRNELVFHFARIVLELKPNTFVMENVPGMAIRSHSSFLNEVIQHFKNAGYQLRLPYRTLNAGNFGVPQSRERLFLFGARPGSDVPEYPAPKTKLRRNGDAELERQPLIEGVELPSCPSVEEAIGDLPDIDEYEELVDSDTLLVRLKGGSRYARVLRGELEDAEDFSYRRKTTLGVLTGCRRANHTELSRERFIQTEGGSTEPVSRFYKLALDGICNTLRAGTASDRGAFTSPRPIHPVYPRCISVREAARLHSYPDWFRFHRTIWHGFRQIGNSVPPLLGRAVGARIAEALGVVPCKPTEVLELGPEELASFNMKQAADHFSVSPKVIPPRKRLNAVS
jgi:DNA (cytosine-5)-methyltransferase 1